MSPRIIKLSCVRPSATPAYIGESPHQKTAADKAREELAILEKRAASLRREISQAEGRADSIIKKAEKTAKKLQSEAENAASEARNKAEKILAKSRKEAETFRNESLEKLEKEKQESLEEAQSIGFAEGLEEGHQKAAEQAGEMLQGLENKLAEADAARAAAMAAADGDILELALAVARKIIKIECQLDKRVILNNIREAIKRVNDKENVTLVISPEDLRTVEENRDRILQAIAGLKHMKVVEDPAIEQGGLVIETNYGTIDACISSQLAELEKRLREEAQQ